MLYFTFSRSTKQELEDVYNRLADLGVTEENVQLEPQ